MQGGGWAEEEAASLALARQLQQVQVQEEARRHPAKAQPQIQAQAPPQAPAQAPAQRQAQAQAREKSAMGGFKHKGHPHNENASAENGDGNFFGVKARMDGQEVGGAKGLGFRGFFLKGLEKGEVERAQGAFRKPNKKRRHQAQDDLDVVCHRHQVPVRVCRCF